ncbi:transposable element Tcb1 transposase [Trichonephila clavipes]|nr:transposable element Tcb1 transposase [Trichonephila clavipes]
MIFYVVELLDDWNVDAHSCKYPRNLESLRVSSPGFDNDSKVMVMLVDVTAQVASELQRRMRTATGTTVSRQTVYRRLGHIGLYARRPVRRVPLTATHCHLRLNWSREPALWTPQQWSCVMFFDESRFSLQSDSRRTLIWRAPECNDDRPHLSGCHFGTCTFVSGAMGAEFLFMDDNARPHNANILDECLQTEHITRMDWRAYSPDLNPIEHVGDMLGRRIAARQPPSHLSTGTSEGIA